MSAFLYFIPNKRAVTIDDIKAAGITAITDIKSIGFCTVEKGPGGFEGVVFAVHPENEKGKLPKIGYYPKNQRWTACNNEAFHIAVEVGDLPTPADLEQSEMISGYETELDDGNEWQVPVALAFGRGSVLPMALLIGIDGALVMEALPKFAELSYQAGRVFDAFLNEGEDLTVQNCFDVAVLALQQNYKVSAWELSVLRCLNTNNVQTVLGNLIDMPVILAAEKEQKKKQSDTASLNDGELV